MKRNSSKKGESGKSPARKNAAGKSRNRTGSKSPSAKKNPVGISAAEEQKMKFLEEYVSKNTWVCIRYFLFLYTLAGWSNVRRFYGENVFALEAPTSPARAHITSSHQDILVEFLLSALLAVGYILGEQNLNRLPLPPPDFFTHKVQLSRFCRAVFLTRHGNYLQCIHFSVNALRCGLMMVDVSIVPVSVLPVQRALIQKLTLLTSANAMICAVLGTTVTVLYLALVVPSPAFQQRHEEVWAASKGTLHLKRAMHTQHVLGLTAALVDLLFLRRPGICAVALPPENIWYNGAFILIFASYYLTLLVFVYHETGAFPYQFMLVLYAKGWSYWFAFVAFLALLVNGFMLLLTFLVSKTCAL
ncbi:unnamed protein product [Amoebophrya sp. A120]|nr:unnamed protein product [Amoebophrya sp. A120]|eukprot:GSA120T00002154001.1